MKPLKEKISITIDADFLKKTPGKCRKRRAFHVPIHQFDSEKASRFRAAPLITSALVMQTRAASSCETVHVHKSHGYLQKPFDIPEKMCYPNRVQGSDEDTPRRKSPREEPGWCNGSVNGNRRIPLLSRPAEMPGRVRPLSRQ